MGHAVREVELVEDDAPDERRPSVRWRRWWPVPVAVLLIAVGAQATLDARARADEARVAALPGTLAPVGSELEVLWTVPADALPVVMAGYEVDGALVGARQAADGTYAATAIDARTGQVRWSTALDEEDAGANPGLEAGRPVCLPGAAGSGRLYCLAGASGGTGRTALTIDASDGAVLTRVEVPAADRLAVDGSTTYLLRARDATTCDVSAVDGEAVRWTTAVTCAPGSSLVAGGGLVAVSAPGDEVTVIGPTGTVIERHERAEAQAGADGLVVIMHDDGRTSRLLRDGVPTIEVPGLVMVPRVDDGSAPGIVVTTDRTTQGFDRRTGRHLWTAPISVAGIPLVRDGRIVDSASSDVVVSIDARTGQTERRIAMRPDWRSADPLTDGRQFLGIALEGTTTPPRVLAIEVAGSDAVHDVRLPPGLIGVQQAGRRVVGIAADGAVQVLG